MKVLKLEAKEYAFIALRLVQVLNPATGKVLATMPKMKGDETLTAIAAAHAVFPTWAQTPAKERGAVLRRYIN
jgi:acyl-CoA reductase-like NAD-dependent aldehyde dehydrogenase